MKRIYTEKEIRIALEDKDLKIVEDIKTAQDKIHCQTKEGYDVVVIPQGIIMRNNKPLIFSKYNPYTISNISLWLKINNIPIEIISKKYLGSDEKMDWKCLICGNLFSTTWAIIRGGKRSCNFCSKSRRYDNKTDYYNRIINECQKYNYILLSDKIPRANSRFEYLCVKHKDKGILHSTYDNMINGNKHCKYCGIENRSLKHRLSEKSIQELVESKGFIYNNVLYPSNGADSRTKIGIICPKHLSKGVQYMSITNLKKSKGRCSYCIGRNRSKEDLQNECDKLGLNILIIGYKKYTDPILVKCKVCKKEWYTSGMNLTQGHSCPNCVKSHFETEVEDVLKEFNIKYVQQYKFNNCRDTNPLPFDFYIKDRNILIEVDGEGHYKPIKRTSLMSDDEALCQLNIIKKHDLIKTNFCKEKGIRLIRIPYWERKNIKNFLKEKLDTL